MFKKSPKLTKSLKHRTFVELFFSLKMENIRDKLGGSESPEDRAKRQQRLVLPNVVSLGVSIVMVVIGIQVSRISNAF